MTPGPGNVASWKPRLKAAGERWPDAGDWRRLGLFTLAILAGAGIFLTIDGDPAEPENIPYGIGFLLVALGAAVLMDAFEWGRSGRAAEGLFVVASAALVLWAAVDLLRGGDDPKLLVIGLLVGSPAALRFFRGAPSD